jgi:hypothetical protein
MLRRKKSTRVAVISTTRQHAPCAFRSKNGDSTVFKSNGSEFQRDVHAASADKQGSGLTSLLRSPRDGVRAAVDDCDLMFFRGLLLARQFPQSQRFSGPVGALEMLSNGDVLVMVLLTALAGKQPESAPEIGFFSAPEDRATSVRWGRSASISIT